MTTPEKPPPPAADASAPLPRPPDTSSESSLSSASSQNPRPPEDSIPLSALQHFLYCPRQCALIHIERQWEENIFTAKGRVLHERTDSHETSYENGIKTVRSLRVASQTLGVFGVCDVVEFHEDGPVPIEYKRGKPKTHRADEVQLCAQAICLEEIFGVHIPEALLFYGRNHRRFAVTLDPELRELTARVAADCRELIESGRTPPGEYVHKRCSACSLLDVCLPRRKKEVKNIEQLFIETLDEDCTL